MLDISGNVPNLNKSNDKELPTPDGLIIPSLDGDLYLNDTFYRWPLLENLNITNRSGYDFMIWRTNNNGQKQVVSWMPMYLPPSSISINIIPASTVFATMKGIVEDQNGAPFRSITISGTSAVYFEEQELPDDGSSTIEQELKATLSYVFGNTIEQAKSIAGTATQLVNSLSSFGATKVPPDDTPLNLKIADGGDKANFVSKYSGYRYFHLLARFFDKYLAMKKRQQNSDVRLTFHMYKDQMYYDCILTGFNFTKPPGSLEYQFNIQLTAYRRRPDAVKEGGGNLGFTKPTKPPYMAYWAKIVNAMTTASLVVAKSSNLLITAKNDIYGAFLKPAYKALMLAKSITGLTQTLDTVMWELNKSNAFKAAWIPIYSEFKKLNDKDLGYGNAAQSSDAQNNKDLKIDTVAIENNGMADGTVTNQPDASPLSPEVLSLTSIADDLSNLNIDMFAKYPEAYAAINSVIDDATSMTLEDLKDAKTLMESTANEIAKSLGGGNSTYDKQMGLDTGATVVTMTTGTSFDQAAVLEAIGAVPQDTVTPVTLTVETIEILSAINDCMMGIDSMISAFQEADPTPKTDYATAYKNMALANDLQFEDSASKFFIPFPYGSTMQSLALQYLGNPDRWIEIAAINGLQPPYIDEDGFEKSLLTSGAGTSVMVSNRDNLYIGQSVEISSDTVVKELRQIVKIDVISSIESLLTLSGEPTLSRFKTLDHARIKAYLPNTVNSDKLIAIPSKIPSSVKEKIHNAPNEGDLDFIGKIALVDFLLQSDGDLVIHGNDIKLAIGYQNLTQAGILKLMTKKGSLINDPTFGNPIQVGTSVADIDLKSQISQLNSLFTSDPRFSGIGATNIRLNGPAVSLNVLVGIRNSSMYMPLTTEIPT